MFEKNQLVVLLEDVGGEEIFGNSDDTKYLYKKGSLAVVQSISFYGDLWIAFNINEPTWVFGIAEAEILFSPIRKKDFARANST